jgi:hypothetical protein
VEGIYECHDSAQSDGDGNWLQAPHHAAADFASSIKGRLLMRQGTGAAKASKGSKKAKDAAKAALKGVSFLGLFCAAFLNQNQTDGTAS